MDENDIVFEDGALAATGEMMFGSISESVTSSDATLTDEEIDLLQQGAIDDYNTRKEIGWTYEFDFPNRCFVKRGPSVATVTDMDSLAQWAMNVIHTNRFSALVYSDDIGIDWEGIAHGIGAVGLLEEQISTALLVHDRIERVRDFSAEWVGRVVLVKFVIETDSDSIEIEGSLQ